MPNYIPSMLSHLCPSGCGSTSSPAVYISPVSHTDLSLHLSPSSITTLSTPVSPAEKTWIQQVVGSLLFYARALDLSFLTAVYQLSSHQSIPTQHDLSSAHHLLNYASSHPNPHKTIHSSSMALWACTDTDASFLSRPKSGSGSVGLGDPPPYLLNPPPESHRQSWKDNQSLVRASRLLQSHSSYPTPPPVTHNAPLHASCQRIPVVAASVAEAEYAAAFDGGQVLVDLTLTLTNLGHPQQSSLSYSLTTNARSVLRLPRLDRRSPSRSTCV
jgi:hypothetical protein